MIMTKFLQLVSQLISSTADFIGQTILKEENSLEKRVIPQYVYSYRTINKNQL
jgi:hypothetical protein